MKSDASTLSETSNQMEGSSSPASDVSSGDEHTVTDQRDNRKADGHNGSPEAGLSRFEQIMTTFPPILESLLLQLPTSSLLDLYGTSKHLRTFLRAYPLAWRTLSFRIPTPVLPAGTPGTETPDASNRQSQRFALDKLLITVIVPHATRLRSLDLCNTAVDGTALVSRVLEPRRLTLQHLSVRGCKNVSIKYHLVPFLLTQVELEMLGELALKSLYTYRCRHHRRRPYLPSSLARRDSDSEPTHDLIELCHKIGIWTDTAWCPTPGARCFRRKDYFGGRATPGTTEVWVPFDRLWRSGNRIGPDVKEMYRENDGRLWEQNETGYEGEALGTGEAWARGEGKETPAHLRRSHTTFIENVSCDQCGDRIHERCESCSSRMHCMGCRKTLCASCAFNRPLPKKKQKKRRFTEFVFGTASTAVTPLYSNAQQVVQRKPEKPREDKFWWAPGATRSPNLMNESLPDEDSSDDDDETPAPQPPQPGPVPPPAKIELQWCCVEPIFSGGGGIAVLGPGALGSKGADRMRAVPLPKQSKYLDPDFAGKPRRPEKIRDLKEPLLWEHVMGEDIDILKLLQLDNMNWAQDATCPRNLCKDCYRSFQWRVSCKGCKRALCKEHDFRGLKIRKCGFRELNVEKVYVKAQPKVSDEEYYVRQPLPEKMAVTASNGSSANTCSTAEPASPGSSADSHKLMDGLYHPANDFSTSLTADDIEQFDRELEARRAAYFGTLYNPSAPPSKLPEDTLPRIQASSSTDDNASLNFQRPRPSRSLSFTGSGSKWNISLPASLPARRPLPLPGNQGHPVQWQGCGSYFCQQSRPVGDNRPRCTAEIKECADCNVLVCDQCISSSPPCSCSYCSVVYLCPYCAEKGSSKSHCRYEAEERERKKKEEEERIRMEREVALKNNADVRAGEFGEFWSALEEITMDLLENEGTGTGMLEDAVMEMEMLEEIISETVAELPTDGLEANVVVQ